MKKIILYPTHRKFIQILERETKYDGFVLLKNEDWIEIVKILGEENFTSVERHKKIYRCLLKIVRTNDYKEDCFPFEISMIRNYISQRERKTFFRTIRNIVLIPIINKLEQIVKRY